MALARVLVHEAVPLREGPAGERIEGEYDYQTLQGPAFDCFLMLEGDREATDSPQGGRKIRRPSMLYEPWDQNGDPVELKAEDEVLITAEELTGPEPVRWQVFGSPEPMAKPGEVKGYEAQLKRVEP